MFVVAFIASLFSAGYAQAGIFSFFGNLFGGNSRTSETSTEVLKTNVSLQAMNLLEAPTNIDVQAGKGGASLNIVGESALIATSGPLGSISNTPASTIEKKTGSIVLYTIKEGDNISLIAHEFGVSVNTILWANDIEHVNLIQPGDVLVILPVSGIRHTVKTGDTLRSIAQTYKGDLEEILSFNKLDVSAILSVGSEIVIPEGEAPTSAVASSASSQLAIVNTKSLKETVGYFIRPIDGGVKSQDIHGYNGIDLAASCGAPIYASADGTALLSRSSGWNGGYGNYIVISHANSTQTLYAHNTSNWVSAGQFVTQGQQIGTVGSTGRSTGCHVHFEVRGAKNPF